MSDDVEVTPELLNRIELAARCAFPEAAWSYVENRAGAAVFDSFTAFEIGREGTPRTGLLLTPSESIAIHVATVDPCTALALVKRIRELESDIEELYERARDEAWERDL